MSTIRLLCTALLLAPCAFSVETKSWLHASQSDFEKGTLKGLSLRSDGLLTLAPALRELHDASTAYLWALASDSKGNLYAGGGGPSSSQSKLFAIDAAGKARELADLPGLQIQSIAIDGRDRVYAATAPDGKVYRIDSGGKFEVFYDPKAKYIWVMAFNSTGDLFVATGDQGEIHRVTPNGSGSVFFRTEETHARSLAVDSKNNLVVGTEPGGLILRISPGGEGFVLYQSSKREVTSVAVSREDIIFAAATGNKSPAGPTPSPLSISVTIPPAPVSTAVSPQAQRPANVQPSLAPAPLPSSAPLVTGGSEVYRIGTDGYPQRVWSHAQDIVYAIGFDPSGKPVVGTGNKGNIYRIDSELASTLLINAAPTQVTAFATGPRGRLFAATGNVGKVYQIGPELEKQGSYESEPLDGASFSYWGRVRQKSDLNGGAVRIDARSGNLDRPHKNWSSWAALDAGSARITAPSARFLQYRLSMSASPEGRSPEVREIELAYMAKNVAPVFDEIEITPANYKFSPSTSVTTQAPATLNLPPLGQRPRTSSTVSLSSLSSGQSMQYANGTSGARWAVTDPNGDELVYKVEIRGSQEREWKLLEEDVKDKFLSWDSTGFADGDYIIRVTASDVADNPADQALSSHVESETFVIDNTAPQISSLEGLRSGNTVSVKWKVQDLKSTIHRAEYSVNGGDWFVVQPTTRLSDSLQHEYILSVPPAGAEQTIAVRVTDEFDNQSVAKVVVR